MDRTRDAIRDALDTHEPMAIAALLRRTRLSQDTRHAIYEQATDWVERCRLHQHDAGTLDVFLREFGLSNDEGVALMCLAEALLRIPDADTADRLIAEKINAGDWRSHLGHSPSAFVNASVWGLMLTGRWVQLDHEITERTTSWMEKLIADTGESVIRRAILQAMRILGRQFVLGRTIEEAQRRARSSYPSGTRFSYDMLGEGARTSAAAERYFDSYLAAIRSVGAPGRATALEADSISIKISALHPRYEWRQRSRVTSELLDRLTTLAKAAAQHGVALSIDAEEADRLELSLDLFEALATAPTLNDWPGLGFVLQELGLDDYPVFTKKAHTDLSYQVCAEALAGAPDAIFAQFASHNAHTIATVQRLTTGQFELQRLHGMGDLLYRQLRHSSVRVYAPVGAHRDLLPYLVRRLLENGANSSFVNRLLDATTAPTDLVRDPVADVEGDPVRRHGQIPLPRELHTNTSPAWPAARGVDLADPRAAERLLFEIDAARRSSRFRAASSDPTSTEDQRVENPARRVPIGRVATTDLGQIAEAVARARVAQRRWAALGVDRRSEALDRLADAIENHRAELVDLITREAGRTIEDTLDEIREAADFCRYYAAQARQQLSTRSLTGPTGEVNELSLHGRGVWAAISPWNFPLAIFVGQITAALVTGNSVLAKPAEQTPLVATHAIALMHSAGIPQDVVQLIIGPGHTVGDALIADTGIDGVVFTGGTETAQLIARRLAAKPGPITPLIAETGGINVMLVDATALPEQVVDDVITSAFGSAGQRCSALRVLYLQADVADPIIDMLTGAMQELVIGDPTSLETDIGPVIDGDARRRIQDHIDRFTRMGRRIGACSLPAACQEGFFVAPTVFEIERLDDLDAEVFGPVLHIIRYEHDELEQVFDDIGTSRFGLTLGVHSRIEGFAERIFESTRVGNTYINRNMVGAVVGVNPFGGQGLSGTGPKAGGPHYLLRFVTERTRTENVTARGGNAMLFNLRDE